MCEAKEVCAGRKNGQTKGVSATLTPRTVIRGVAKPENEVKLPSNPL
ncbi:hypothetical protein ACI1TM_01995 [Lactococcus garvieae]